MTAQKISAHLDRQSMWPRIMQREDSGKDLGSTWICFVKQLRIQLCGHSGCVSQEFLRSVQRWTDRCKARQAPHSPRTDDSKSSLRDMICRAETWLEAT